VPGSHGRGPPGDVDISTHSSLSEYTRVHTGAHLIVIIIIIIMVT